MSNTKKSMHQRVMSAGLWSLLLRGALRSAGFVRNVVLARLLAPQDFGLFGIVLVILSFQDRFSSTGLQAALIQKKEDIGDYLDTAWTIQLLRSAGLGLLLALGAPLLARFFEEPGITSLIRVLGIAVFISGATSPGVIAFRRAMDFRPQFIQRFGGTIVDLVISIILAVILRNVWALMIGLLVGKLSRLIISFAMHSYRPRFRIQWAQARELSTYGRWVFLNAVLFFLAYRGDNLVIGKFLGAASLGIYMLAYSISEVIAMEIGRVMTDIAFPAFSRIQDRTDQLREAFGMSIELVSSITVPVAIVLFLFAKEITNVVLGPRWIGVEVVLPALAIAGSFRAITTNGLAAFFATGRPDLSFRMNLLGVVVTFLPMIFLIRWYGLLGVGIAVAGGQVAMLFPFLVYSRKVIGIKIRTLLMRFVPSLILGLVVVVVSILARMELPDSGLGLVGSLFAAGLSYLACAALLMMMSRSGPMTILVDVLKRSRMQRERKSGSIQQVTVPCPESFTS